MNRRLPPGVTLRTELRPGDVGWIVRRHGILYAREHGFDATFEAYVAAPLAACVLAPSTRDRIWIAERDGENVGCAAVVTETSPDVAQLRWLLVEPEARGQGVGRALLAEAVEFAREAGYAAMVLWTVSALEHAARLYRSMGFAKVEGVPGQRWGVGVTEEKYALPLGGADDAG